MPRRTRIDVEQLLVKGEELKWQDGTSRKSILLDSARARRLAAFVLNSNVRDGKGLPESFLAGLSSAYAAEEDPATLLAAPTSSTVVPGPWRLVRLETEGFGGLNSWRGSAFTCDFDGQSLQLDGANGSGKTSFVGAIAWALTGDRPRDAAVPTGSYELSKVFDAAGKPIGNWPSLATYPENTTALSTPAAVRVKLTFRNDAGVEGSIERTLRNGQVSEVIDSHLELPRILIEAGVMMPLRLNRIRFGSSEGPLVDAVQMVTGLDEVAALGDFVAELCHKSREYLGYARVQRRDDEERGFNLALQQANDALKPLGRLLTPFRPDDTKVDGSLAQLRTELMTQAAALLEVIKADLAGTIDLAKAEEQRQVSWAIDQARRDIASGPYVLQPFATVREIEAAITETVATELRAAMQIARVQLDEALRLREAARADRRFRLKALAAAFHDQHSSGPVENCPLCEQSLREKPELAKQLDGLRSAGEAAQRTFADSANAISRDLENAIPNAIQRLRHEVAQLSPRSDCTAAVRKQFVQADVYRGCLAGLAGAVAEALSTIPTPDVQPASASEVPGEPEGARQVREIIAVAERFIVIAEWARENHAAWKAWWSTLAGTDQTPPPEGSLSAKLDRLDEAVKASEPFRAAAIALGQAWKHGRALARIDLEQQRRQAIADALDPLKSLRNFVEIETRNAIEGLSARMSRILADVHIVERLQFQSAHLDKKTGITVRGSFEPSMRIDATLVANTSWLRALLWAFVFSTREEAVDQLEGERLPLVVLDDPQATFDITHRYRWAKYIAALQAAPTPIQVILATYDESFLEDLSVAKVGGRSAVLTPVATDPGCAQVLEGAAIDRLWLETTGLGTQQAAQNYIARIRVYTEAILKTIIRGEVSTQNLVLGDIRDKIKQWHQQKIAPWNRAQFRDLANALAKGRAEVKYLESAHHASGRNLGMGEAMDVQTFWKKDLRAALDKCFHAIREHRLLHGGSRALYADPPSAPALDGHCDVVKTIPLALLGRAAALTGGKVADGAVDMTELSQDHQTRVVLGHHEAFRLTSPTLEPVARPGDILLVAIGGEVPSGSLVVAICADRLLARRLQFASDHPDVAVLTAQSVNPREIAPPVLAHISTVSLRKIVGVLFDPLAFAPSAGGHEVVDCGGSRAILGLVKGTFGLVQVSGSSAEPLALHNQYLLVKDPVSGEEALRTLNGRPVIAADSDDARYFKRLRVFAGGSVVLESLDAGGNYAPIALAPPGSVEAALDRVWPVAGVLFENPD